MMASGPITSWQADGETLETVGDFVFLGSKISADGDWSHEIKRHLLLGRKVMTNFSSVQFSSVQSLSRIRLFALIAKEGFLISPCCSLKLCIQMLISFVFPFAVRYSSFHSYL